MDSSGVLLDSTTGRVAPHEVCGPTTRPGRPWDATGSPWRAQRFPALDVGSGPEVGTPGMTGVSLPCDRLYRGLCTPWTRSEFRTLTRWSAPTRHALPGRSAAAGPDAPGPALSRRCPWALVPAPAADPCPTPDRPARAPGPHARRRALPRSPAAPTAPAPACAGWSPTRWSRSA